MRLIYRSVIFAVSAVTQVWLFGATLLGLRAFVMQSLGVSYKGSDQISSSECSFKCYRTAVACHIVSNNRQFFADIKFLNVRCQEGEVVLAHINDCPTRYNST